MVGEGTIDEGSQCWQSKRAATISTIEVALNDVVEPRLERALFLLSELVQ